MIRGLSAGHIAGIAGVKVIAFATSNVGITVGDNVANGGSDVVFVKNCVGVLAFVLLGFGVSGGLNIKVAEGINTAGA